MARFNRLITMINDVSNIGGFVTDAERSIDPTSVCQNHVSQSITQNFSIERSRTLHNKRLNITMLEHILKDQFGNLYVEFVSRLADGESWAVADWVGTEKWTELGTKEIVLVRDYKRFKTFSDDLLAYLQEKAFIAFAQETLTWLKGQNAATLNGAI